MFSRCASRISTRIWSTYIARKESKVMCARIGPAIVKYSYKCHPHLICDLTFDYLQKTVHKLLKILTLKSFLIPVKFSKRSSSTECMGILRTITSCRYMYMDFSRVFGGNVSGKLLLAAMLFTSWNISCLDL